ncbi:dehydrogenase [Candidatus Poribacteria bacterium]|nr:dehydrogenase [Candidatus Poribacteria bacterium]
MGNVYGSAFPKLYANWSNQMTRAAVIGYGFAGRCFHTYLVGLANGLELHSIATRDPERRAAAQRDYPDAKCVATMDEVLADSKVDLVVLATPHNTHRDLAVQAMDAGKHVVVDKVVAMDAAETIEMAEAAKRNRVLFSVFHNRRWDWDFLTVQRAIQDGYLGEPYLFESAIMRYGKPGGWRGVKSQSGGILYDWGAHLMDQALQIVPSKVESVSCQIQHRGWDTDIGSYVQVNINFENGVIYRVEVGNLSLYARPRFQVFGDQGTFVKTGVDPQEPFMIRGDIDAAVEEPEHQARVWTMQGGERREFTMETVRGSWRSYYQNIADVLNNGAELVVTPEQMVRLMQVYDAAMTAAEYGVTIPLGI